MIEVDLIVGYLGKHYQDFEGDCVFFFHFVFMINLLLIYFNMLFFSCPVYFPH